MRRELPLIVALVGCARSPATAPPPAVAVPPVAAPILAPPASRGGSPGTTRAARRPREPRPVVTSTMTLAKDPLMEQLLAEGGAALQKVLASPEEFRFQVLYGTIENGKLERFGYRADAEYFFPASSMKVPIAFATVARATKAGIPRDALLRLFPVSGSGEPTTTTIAREAYRALVVSDNSSANRLLAIGGHREIHETLWGVDLTSARIRTGFATGADIDPAEISPRIAVVDPPREIAPRKSDLVLPPNDAKSLEIGKATIENGRRVEAPLSFANKNAMKLRELQDTLVRIMRPDLLPDATLTDADREYLQKTLGTLPSESGLAGYDRNVVADYQLDPLLRGIERVRPRGTFKVYSKVGQAYGFLISNAYVVETDTGRAFFLTAAVFANPDDVMNDDVYAYDTIAFPVLADVGEVFTRHAFD